MRLFESLRSLVKPKSNGVVPVEIIAALVDDLYSALRSLAIGAIAGVLVGGIVASRTGSPWLMFLTAATAAVAATRALLVIALLQAQVVHRWRSGRGASLGTMVRDWCLGLRGMSWKHVLCRGRIHRRPILPSAACCLRGRICGRDYGAYLQPTVDRHNVCFLHFIAHRPRQCVSRRVGLYDAFGDRFPVLSRRHRTGAIFGRKSTALAAHHRRARGAEFPLRHRACQHVARAVHV